MSKVLEIKNIKLGNNESNYKELITASLNFVPQEKGLKIDEQRKRLRILEALEKSDGVTLTLEDADAETLVALIDSMVWAIFSKDIVQFTDDIKAMKTV